MKSHEVARRKYVETIKLKTPQAFDIPHYILSCDVLQVMTAPESLNGETGLICKVIDSKEFPRLQVHEIIQRSKQKKHIPSGLN